jgi:hypothetical protein
MTLLTLISVSSSLPILIDIRGQGNTNRSRQVRESNNLLPYTDCGGFPISLASHINRKSPRQKEIYYCGELECGRGPTPHYVLSYPGGMT